MPAAPAALQAASRSPVASSTVRRSLERLPAVRDQARPHRPDDETRGIAASAREQRLPDFQSANRFGQTLRPAVKPDLRRKRALDEAAHRVDVLLDAQPMHDEGI